MPLTSKEVTINLGGIIGLIAKLIRFSKGGLSKEEREELAVDLISLASKVVPAVID
jgi:hypothetical protein